MRVKYIRYILPPGQSTFKHWSFKKLQRKDVGAIPFEGVSRLGEERSEASTHNNGPHDGPSLLAACCQTRVVSLSLPPV